MNIIQTTRNTAASLPWCVYIVQCNDGTLYTGITTNLNRRIQEHNNDNIGAKYTRSRRPVRLVYFEQADSRSAAAKREWEIKRMPLVITDEELERGIDILEEAFKV